MNFASEKSTQSHETKMLTICAASASWLCKSAAKANYAIDVFDLFSDWDTKQVANRCVQLKNFGELRKSSLDLEGVERLVIGGGLESNLEAFSDLAPENCWRNSTLESIQFVRDPFRWSSLLGSHGIGFAKVARNPFSGALEKSFDSTAGHGVRFPNTKRNDSGSYFQQFIRGESLSSSHLANGRDSKTLGWFLQVSGERRLNAKPFHYCGSIGPLSAPSQIENAKEVAKLLVGQSRLEGLFGIDWVGADPVPIEINPRPTASMELLDRVQSQSLLQIHLNALENQVLCDLAAPTECLGKVIIYNDEQPFCINENLFGYLFEMFERDLVSDLPNPDSWISSGAPFLTFWGPKVERMNVECAKKYREDLVIRAVEFFGRAKEISRLG